MLKKLPFFLTQIGHFLGQICTKVNDLSTSEAPSPKILHARTALEFISVAQNFFSALWQACFVTLPASVASAVDKSIR